MLIFVEIRTRFYRQPPSNFVIRPAPSQNTQLIVSQPQASNAKSKVLFIGNSHTSFHNLPQLVSDLINFQSESGRTAAGLFTTVSLDGLMSHPQFLKEVASGNWETVVLQGQRISSSGKYNYPTEEGVRLAKYALEKKCRVYFFSEWGLQDTPNHSEFTETIYRSMANESGAELIAVGKVWESVLAADPQIKLYGDDKNHQSRLGASLTALVIASQLIGQSPESFREFRDPVATEAQWQLFVEKAAEVAQQDMK